MERIYNFPKDFVDAWNKAASDGEVGVDEISHIKSVAQATPEMDDDTFLSDIEFVTMRPLENPFKKSAVLCDARIAAVKAGLEIDDVKVYFVNTEEARRVVKLWGTETECGDSVEVMSFRSSESEGDSGDLHMRSDLDAGYQYLRWDDAGSFAGDSHGLHLSANFTPWSSRHFYPALEGQLNFVFKDFGISGGAGIGLHAGRVDLWGEHGVQVYGKAMFNGHGAKTDGWKDGWSLDAVAGLRVFCFYAEAVFPIVGSEFMPSRGFSGVSAGLVGHIGRAANYNEGGGFSAGGTIAPENQE